MAWPFEHPPAKKYLHGLRGIARRAASTSSSLASWEKRHRSPFRQPPGCKNQAQGFNCLGLGIQGAGLSHVLRPPAPPLYQILLTMSEAAFSSSSACAHGKVAAKPRLALRSHCFTRHPWAQLLP